MKVSLSVLILVVNLSGCLGLEYTRNVDVVGSTIYSSRYPERLARKPNKTNPDGSESYVIAEETKWCGLTIWAIIPIPLLLPVCHARTWVTYKDGKQIQWTSQVPKTSVGMCGPLVPSVANGHFCVLR
jgi:hypothetical protein